MNKRDIASTSTVLFNANRTQVSIESKKRPLSPTFEPDMNKKFCILEKNMNKPKNDFDMSDLTVDDSEFPNINIDNIRSLLEDDIESTPQENRIVLQATNSVISSDNSILLHQPTCTADLILSPISQMCDVTSGLALSTPKKVKDLTRILEEPETKRVSDDQKLNKLFPVFYPGHTAGLEKKEKVEKVMVNAEKKFKKLPPGQMLINAGQKKFGITLCSEYNYVYHEGDPNNEIMHSDFHSARLIMQFSVSYYFLLILIKKNND